MSIRLAVESDFSAIADLLRQLNPNDPSICDRAGLQAFRAITNSDAFKLIVAELDEQIVSTCYLNIVPNLTRNLAPYAVIENVVTDTQHRGGGLGQAVVEYAVKLALASGCYKVMLMTGRSGDNIKRFYERCGFSAEEKRAFVLRAVAPG